MKKLKASFTIEAAIIVPITMFIIMAFIYAAFYAHDQVIEKTDGENYILESPASYEDEDTQEEDARGILLKYRAIADGIDFLTEDQQ